ncbi:regulatory protein RecX [Solwaraspora sp. WMMD406]|uniref:regulatory protein RecX n=1 Tax=Solwaraspora sp. WMMD406 TaxID=3016095 RepID=UPI0024167E3B|nr:regulatory protein RecX [Solwaraspora sp. WMMD406]MDG4767072.1 regulatory protein RecX [Solwaraspora sp. WMMD406]
MAGRRRGARTGRGWDAAPPRPRATRTDDSASAGGPAGAPNGGSTDGRATPVPARESPPVDEAQRARDICLRQLAARPRTRAELATVLRRRGISDDVAQSVLQRYDEVGMIDDAAFASAWVTSRHHGRGLARRSLAVELRQRGVDPETAREALDGLDEATEQSTARELVDRKLRTIHGPPVAVFRRLVGMLARKGYSAGVAVPVVRAALAAQSAEAADFTASVDADAMIDAAPDPDVGTDWST